MVVEVIHRAGVYMLEDLCFCFCFAFQVCPASRRSSGFLLRLCFSPVAAHRRGATGLYFLLCFSFRFCRVFYVGLGIWSETSLPGICIWVGGKNLAFSRWTDTGAQDDTAPGGGLTSASGLVLISSSTAFPSLLSVFGSSILTISRSCFVIFFYPQHISWLYLSHLTVRLC